MNKLYVHKKKPGKITCFKNTIVVDLNKIKGTYFYKNNHIKNPKTLILTDNSDHQHYPFVLKDFSVNNIVIDDKVKYIDKNLEFNGFDNVKDLVIPKTCQNVETCSLFGLKSLENLTIPFEINYFKSYLYNGDDINLKTITIKHDDLEYTIDINENMKSICELDYILAYNLNNESLVITSINDTKIKYKIFIDNNKLNCTKEYLNYNISNESFDEILDLTKIKKQYNCSLSISNKIDNCKKLIFSKNNFYELKDEFKCLKNFSLKEICIKDNNDMSLFPKDININLKHNEYFDDIKFLDNDNILVNIKKTTDYSFNKHIYINNDYSSFEIDIYDFLAEVCIDTLTNKFSYSNRKLTIPLNGNIMYVNEYLPFDLTPRYISVKLKNEVVKYPLFYSIASYLIQEIYFNSLRNELKIIFELNNIVYVSKFDIINKTFNTKRYESEYVKQLIKSRR